MLQITEDTPPDMLAGAMDLTVHLPNGNCIKMSAERSTPMMDLLVQITTNHHLQLSGYTLQPLEMAPTTTTTTTTTGYCNDKILPFKPNTPIGVLDTQHIRVVPKIKTIPKTLQKSSSIISNNSNSTNNIINNNNNGYHQPFESTFRLKVYLPRNQLYVTRISQNVYLEDILKKVCDEKHLDPQKYEFRHPGNLDEILDPKLTLSDYQITELHLVIKGTVGLQQTFATNDLMTLRKEEERKQMHNKTGGGVFNLIFRRGKTSSGSVSSENRSISPTHSDDSRSVTPPGVVVSSSTLPAPSSISSAVADKPKPPQRKRRPAPKPPQIIETKEIEPPTTTQTTTTTAKEVETTSTTTKKLETGLTICHSRNSSDSSGYHEASVLSDNCGNTSLPRRPRSTTIDTNDDNNNNNNNNNRNGRIIIGKFSQSTSNLSKMSIQSKSTSSLSITGRKKKTAPPPPPPVVKQSNSTNVDDNHKQPPSPVVASQNAITAAAAAAITTINIENHKIQDLQGDGPVTNPNPPPPPPPPLRLLHNVPIPAPRNKILNNTPISNDNNNSTSSSSTTIETNIESNPDRLNELQSENEEKQVNEAINQTVVETTNTGIVNNGDGDGDDHKESIELEQKPEIIPKNNSQSMFDSLTRKRGFHIGSSLLNDNNNDETNSTSLNTDVNNNNDELITNDELFNNVSLKTNSENTITLNQLYGIHDYDDGNKSKNFQKTLSVSSLRSVTSIPGFLGNTNMKKWDNIEELDDISLQSVKWVIGGDKNTDVPDANSIQKLDDKVDEKPISDIESLRKTELVEEPNNLKEEIINSGGGGGGDDFETQEWQYQLPSPPKAFRDSSPPPTFTNANDNAAIDSVVTSPELFEKLQSISDNQTDKADSNFSDIDDNKSILNKLSLENLEKRKSLVYNRELATSLKQQHEEEPQETIVEKDKITTKIDEDYVDILMKFEKTLDELQQKTTSSHQSQQQQQQQQRKATITKSTLPNFKITTYDNPKQKLNIFEDDTIRSNRKFDKNNKKTPTTQIRRNSNDGKSSSSLLRTESFQQNHWSPVKPVTRSKSSVALNKYNQNNKHDDYIYNQLNNNDNNNNNNNEENLIKSNSLFDVSGLQSLGVMRLIQSKLNTPMNSIGGNLNTVDNNNNNNNNENNNKNYQTQSDDKTEVQNNNNNNNFNSSNNDKIEKSYQYISTTPSINMGTWSERPKIPVNLKSDPDYKFNNNNNNNNSNNRRFSPVYNNGVNVRISSDYKNVSIKVNGSEPISAENSGNVVIKIGEQQQQQQQQQNRKPLGNINKIETNKQRPHSIAFDSGFDVSRLPVVRSVELKKPYKDLQNPNNNNTSITQINENKSNETNKHSNSHRSTETLSVQQQQQQIEPKFRLNSFVQNSAPVVRGFRHNDNNYRFSWNQPHSYSSTSTMKNKEQSSSQQQQSPFQVNLRRTVSTKMNDLDKKMMPAPPPPPPPPIAPLRLPQPSKSTKSARSPDNCGVDPKEQLLQAIRDFGGKKGLRALKA